MADDGCDGGDGSGRWAPRWCARWTRGDLLWEIAGSPARAGRRRRRLRCDRTLGVRAGTGRRQRATPSGRCRRRDADVRAGRGGLARSRLAGAGGARRAARRANCTRCGRRVQAIGTAVERRRQGVPVAPRRDSTSYGNGALGRAAAVGAVFAGEPASAGLAASLDAAVTHADRRATAASAALAAIIAGLDPAPTRRPMPVEIVVAVVATWRAASDVRDVPDPARWRRGEPIRLAPAWRWGVHADDDARPRRVVRARRPTTRRRRSPSPAAWSAHGSHVAGAITGALVGAIHGAAALRRRGTATSRAPTPTRLPRRRVAAAAHRDADRRPSSHGSDIWFLLDRSGSMAVDRRRRRGRLRPLLRRPAGDRRRRHRDHRAVRRRRPPRRARRRPPARRGALDRRPLRAPWLDAAVRRHRPAARPRRAPRRRRCRPARRHPHRRRTRTPAGAGPSSACSPASARCATRGWTFVFLGANQDSYAAGGQVGFHAGNVSNFTPTPGCARRLRRPRPHGLASGAARTAPGPPPGSRRLLGRPQGSRGA